MFPYNVSKQFQVVCVTSITLVVLLLVIFSSQPAFALIMGGEGNSPIRDPGWPNGAEKIFNNPARIAYWEGPPFGGGQWHSECRGNVKALNAVLIDFDKIEAKTKRVVVHEGIGHSLWLNPNRDPAKQDISKVDWVFLVWQPASWEHLRKLPVDILPVGASKDDKDPPVQIDIYTGGQIRWSDVVVPKGVELIDERLEAHGFTPADGTVIEGNVIDLETKQPIAARILLQKIESEPKGKYNYKTASETAANDKGNWIFKNVANGGHRVVVEADGYVQRIAGNFSYDQPNWHSYKCGLARAATVEGRVTDDTGSPLADVKVLLGNVGSPTDGRYDSPHEYSTQTDANGLFHLDSIPVGSATILLSKSGYCHPGLVKPFTVPAKDIELKMLKAAQLQVTVDFAGTNRPAEYIVGIEPESGSVVGSWGGSGIIDAKNQISYKDVPPGRYVLTGHPNPSREDEKTKPLTVELKGGETKEVTLPVRK